MTVKLGRARSWAREPDLAGGGRSREHGRVSVDGPPLDLYADIVEPDLPEVFAHHELKRSAPLVLASGLTPKDHEEPEKEPLEFKRGVVMVALRREGSVEQAKATLPGARSSLK